MNRAREIDSLVDELEAGGRALADSERCRWCGAYIDDMNTDAKGLIVEGEEFVWCGEEHFDAWKNRMRKVLG